MNLQDTVSKILGHEVSLEGAMDFANRQFGMLAMYLRENNPKYPNGITSWKETYYQFSVAIQNHLDKMPEVNSVVWRRYTGQGLGGMWELAEEFTNEFEQLNKDREWDGEYFDEIDEFFNKKNLVE